MVDDSWNAINHLVAPPSSQLLTADAIRKPGWSLADLMVEALEELGGRLTFGVFTRLGFQKHCFGGPCANNPWESDLDITQHLQLQYRNA